MKAQARLDQLYREIKDVILSRQHPVTGLLPASTSVNSHGDYTDAWVRDNVYSILAPWALSVAFKRHGDRHRHDEMAQATVKLMRGLLQSMMRQADKVETFKHTLGSFDALHAKYDTSTGLAVVADNAWGHLQIDATSLFLLKLAQMTASGLRIIRTFHEVDFVQNLMYYVASAYRTSDYGIWERGNKINNGKTEINASSVGMAKAALQALDGLNLFGSEASDRAVVHTVPDSISLARNTLSSLLPRESLSKEVDSALLSIIGFPAFAVGDNKLVTKTRDAILNKLGGKYGCKRFLWDGHQTVIEDPHRLYYEHSELADFEHIESEWPLFFTYLYISALFEGNRKTAEFYRSKIESIMVEVDGARLIPELYYLPKEHIAGEKLSPGSQARLPNANIPLVWAQSIYYTALLLDEELLATDDLDAVGLRVNTTRFNLTQVALVVLSENKEVKKILSDRGVLSESLDDIAPLKVVSAPHLVEAYAQVGANTALGLSGRPRRRLQSLATSQTYDINHQKCLCLSWVQSDEDYRMRDADLVSSQLLKEIIHIRAHWVNTEAAVFTFMMSNELCSSSKANVLFDTLRHLQLRTNDENVGYASASLAYRASRENTLFIPNICLNPIRASEYRDLAVETESALEKEPQISDIFQANMSNQPAAYQYIDTYIATQKDESVKHKQLSVIYEYVQHKNLWLLARFSFSTLHHAHSDLSDYLSVLSARHFSIIIGSEKKEEFVLDPGLSNSHIIERLQKATSNVVELCLLQEVLVSIGVLHRTRPNLFDGLRSIHLHNLLKICCDKVTSPWSDANAIEVGQFSPADIFNKIERTLDSQRSAFMMGVDNVFPTTQIQNLDEENDSYTATSTDWYEWRVARGLIVNLDRRFLEAIWQSFAHTSHIIFGDKDSEECVIDCEFVRRSMTAGEDIFAHYIDDAIQKVHPAYYKSAIVETLLAFTRFSRAHPDLYFTSGLNLSKKLEDAAAMYCTNNKNCLALARNVDALLQESPEVLQSYLYEALKEASKKKAFQKAKIS